MTLGPLERDPGPLELAPELSGWAIEEVLFSGPRAVPSSGSAPAGEAETSLWRPHRASRSEEVELEDSQPPFSLIDPNPRASLPDSGQN